MSHHITELSVRLILYISVVSTAKDVRKCHVAPKMHPNRKNKKFKQTKHKKDKTYARKNKSILPSQKKKTTPPKFNSSPQKFMKVGRQAFPFGSP